MIKLAIRTGADLVPVYLFGNTKILSCWAGEGIPYGRSVLEWISRRVGFATILIFGRFGIPIPKRIPVMCVMGKGVPTYHLRCEEPSMEQIKKVQGELLDAMTQLFDKHKALYGWDDATLIIK
jgi:2-acylglycerol O-acyltransferase 2